MNRLTDLCLYVAAFAVAACGGIVIGGWFVESPMLVQIRPDFAPMQFNTAVAFVLVGLAMICCVRRWKTPACAMALATGAIGLLTLVEYGAGVSLGIDNLIVTPFTAVASAYSGRMAPNTAICFLLISAAIYLAASRRGRQFAIPALLAMAVLSLALVSLGGYVVGVSSAYTWGRFVPMAIHTSMAFVVTSAAVIAFAWARSGSRWPDWAPIVSGLSAFLMSVLIWKSLIVYENDQALNTATVRTAGQCKTLEHELNGLVDAIERMAAREARRFDGSATPGWAADADVYRRHFPAIKSLTLYGPTGIAIESTPPQAGSENWAAAPTSLTASRPHVQTYSSGESSPGHGQVERFSVIVPLDRDGRRIGYLETDCRLADFVEACGWPTDGPPVSVVDITRDSSRSGDDHSSVAHTLTVADARWRLTAQLPLANSTFSIPIALVLILGATEALLIAMTMRLLAKNREQAWKLSDANERLRLAIDGGNIGTWEWNMADNSTYTSAELNGQLGHEPGTLNSYAEWESRLHPNDCERVKSTVQQCIDGVTEGYESVYRLRHASGTYRRILARGRVFRDADERPQRMAGTHVDITQQHEIEQLFHAVFNEAIQFMGILSPEGVVIEANRAALVAAGVAHADVIGQFFWDTPWWTHSPELQVQLRLAIARAAQGVMERFEATHIDADGSEIIVDFSLKPVRDLAGDVIYIIPEGRDITEYRRRSPKVLSERRGNPHRNPSMHQQLDDLAEVVDEAAAELLGS